MRTYRVPMYRDSDRSDERVLNVQGQRPRLAYFLTYADDKMHDACIIWGSSFKACMHAAVVAAAAAAAAACMLDEL